MAPCIFGLPIVVLGSLVLGCQSPKEPGARWPKPPAPAQGKEPEAAELSGDEALVLKEIGDHARALGERIGERNQSHEWELADAADYIAAAYEANGYQVAWQGYDVEHMVAHNLTAVVPGRERGYESIVIAAHYDTRRGDRGYEGTTATTSALLSLSRVMRDAAPQRTIRFVSLALGEDVSGQLSLRGSEVLVKSLEKEAVKVVCFLELSNLGSLQDSGGQRLISLSGNGESRAWLPEFEQGLSGSPFQILGSGPLGAPGSGDAESFAVHGVPAFRLAGAGRGPWDPADLARLVARLRYALLPWIRPGGLNDAILTPLP